jgi:HEAT repeat protein
MAVLAVATLGLDADRLPAVVVGDRALSVLRARYSAEGSAAVRAEIVKTAALCNDVGAARETIILEALGDSDAGVLAFALTGVGAMRLERAVDKVAPSLGHEDKRVRIAAATALGRLGRAALPKIASLDEALALETDEVVKQTLQATVNSLRRLPQ